MNLELKDFQQAAVGDLCADLHAAKEEILRRGRPQAIMLSAPTASGKTVMITALIEKILGGDGGIPDDHQFDAEPDAVFLWLSDQPELNRQSRLRLLASSNRLRPHDLVIVAADLDAESFDGGKVFFLNSQKLGRDKLLTSYGNRRQWTIWDTIRNTQQRQPDRFYIVIDEAHRGMNVSAQERAQANSIVQKFILGSPTDGLPPSNLIVGISATPERFTNFLAGTNRPLRQHSVDPADVRASGLIKDRIVLHPGENQPSPWTLLAEACSRLTEMADEWHRYAAANDVPRIDPALIIQIEDGTEHTLTRTPLGTLFDILQAQLPGLTTDQVVHCLQSETPITTGDWRIRSADPSAISADPTIRVVLFKMALTTGWDCPRAEVMISFRAAKDATYIAQLVGRMVRTPLAERIHGNEHLNDVYLFLPRYDETTLASIIDRLTRDKENVPASDIVTSRTAATFRARRTCPTSFPPSAVCRGIRSPIAAAPPISGALSSLRACSPMTRSICIAASIS
jgi:type III restriction enzyme